MHEILFRKCILVGIRIGIDNKVLITCSSIRTCPKEVFSLLSRRQFTWNPYVTIEHTLYFRRNIVTVFVFQHCNLTVHFSTGKETHNYLPVLLDKLLKRGFIRCLNSQNRLRCSIYILRIFELRLCIQIFVHLNNDNIADQLQCRVIVCRRSIHNTE